MYLGAVAFPVELKIENPVLSHFNDPAFKR